MNAEADGRAEQKSWSKRTLVSDGSSESYCRCGLQRDLSAYALHLLGRKPSSLECSRFALLKLVFSGLVIVSFVYFYFHDCLTDVAHANLFTTYRLSNEIEFWSSDSEKNSSFPRCEPIRKSDDGFFNVTMEAMSIEELVKKLYWLRDGGVNVPVDCMPEADVAIVVPYRDRESHLRTFLFNIHTFLTRQQLHYGVFIVEPLANETFNRGKLMNIGFREALKMYNWSCFVFHDVDLLPENDNISYACRDSPRHLSVAIDKFKYELPYVDIFGGVTALTTKQIVTINGYSNDFWGWGGEDDNFGYRVRKAGFKISRYPATFSRYKMLKHRHDKKNPPNACRFKLLKYRPRKSGLRTLEYELVGINVTQLYVRIIVNTLEEKSRAKLKKICG